MAALVSVKIFECCLEFSMAPGSPYFASAAQLVQIYLVICSMSLMWDDTSHSACRLHKRIDSRDNNCINCEIYSQISI